MAVVIANLPQYLETVLLITNQPTRLAIASQGLTAYDDFLTLIEKDIADICSNIR